MLNTVCEALAADRPLKLLLAGSLLIACAYCAWMFDADFLLGTSAFWHNPRGLMYESWADIPTSLSGYAFFQRDVWQIPLFHVEKLGPPDGTNIIYTDSIPWVAIVGRLVFRITGVPVNLFGAWTALCFIASALSLTAVVAKLGQRGIAAAAMATIAGLCMPELLFRWGHMALMGQFEILLALIFYLYNRVCNNAWRLFAWSFGLTLLSLWTNPYLFAMVGSIVFVTILQSVFEQALRWRTAFAVLAGLTIVLSVVMALSGHLQSHAGLGDFGFGEYSMNVWSPILPQRSGLLPRMRNLIVDGTGRRSEGFSYLGGGILLLLFTTVLWQARTLGWGLRRHPWLWGLFIGFTLFALSNDIYLGPREIIHLPLPGSIVQAGSVFRSSGRFFWPVMYCLTALAITAVIPTYGRHGVLLLVMAACLQWIDTAPLRNALAASTRAPEKPQIDLADWQAAIAQHRSILVLPQYLCLALPREWNSHLTIQLQLLAAFADRPINSVYAARSGADCAADQRIDGTPRPGARELSVFLNEFAGFAHMQALAATSDMCRAGTGIVVCSDIPGETPTLAKLVESIKQ